MLRWQVANDDAKSSISVVDLQPESKPGLDLQDILANTVAMPTVNNAMPAADAYGQVDPVFGDSADPRDQEEAMMYGGYPVQVLGG